MIFYRFKIQEMTSRDHKSFDTLTLFDTRSVEREFLRAFNFLL